MQGDIWALFIRKEYEGRGIGHSLMDLAERWMFEQGCQKITLSTDHNSRAAQLYRRRQWREETAQPGEEARFCLCAPAQRD